MKCDNYFRNLENQYHIQINKNLQIIIEEYFGDNLNIYTEEDLYEQIPKIIQTKKYKYYKK